MYVCFCVPVSVHLFCYHCVYVRGFLKRDGTPSQQLPAGRHTSARGYAERLFCTYFAHLAHILLFWPKKHLCCMFSAYLVLILWVCRSPPLHIGHFHIFLTMFLGSILTTSNCFGASSAFWGAFSAILDHFGSLCH